MLLTKKLKKLKIYILKKIMQKVFLITKKFNTEKLEILNIFYIKSVN